MAPSYALVVVLFFVAGVGIAAYHPEGAKFAVRALDEPVDRHGTFRSGGWTPHITLGRRFTADQVAAALTTLGNVPSVDAAATRMRLWDMATHQESWPAGPPG